MAPLVALGVPSRIASGEWDLSLLVATLTAFFVARVLIGIRMTPVVAILTIIAALSWVSLRDRWGISGATLVFLIGAMVVSSKHRRRAHPPTPNFPV